MRVYPEWVLKHKVKGTELRCIKGRYYLYQVHCVRENGKNKKITDKYLGRITEEGLIPPKDKITSVKVLEHGLSCFLYDYCSNIYKGLVKTDKRVADDIYIRAIINVIYGRYTEELFNRTFLSHKYNHINPSKTLTDNTINNLNRCIQMMNSYLDKEFSLDERHELFLNLSDVYVVYINKKYYLSDVSEKQKKVFERYGIEWGV